MSASYTARRGWAKQLCSQAKAGGAIAQHGRVLAGAIEANIPVVTGELKAEWGSMTPELEMGPTGIRAQLPIGTSIWHLIEFGSVHNEAYAPIRKGADQARLEFDGSAGAG